MTRRLALLALTVSLACSKTNDTPVPSAPPADAGAPPAPVDNLKAVAEVESNDTPQTAQTLTESSRVTGQIAAVQPATRPDEDWYLIAPTVVPQDLSVAVASLVSGPLEIEVYDRDHNKIMSHALPIPSAPSVATVVFPAVRVRDQLFVRLASPKASGKYTLELKLSPPDPDREAEPNDKPLDATPLPLDHPMRGTYGTEGDQDFYVVQLEPTAPTPAPAPAPETSDAGTAPTAPPAVAATPAPATPDAGTLPTPATAAPPTALLRIDVTGVPGIRHALTVFDDNQVPFATLTAREVGGPLNVRDLPLRPGMSHVTLLLESAMNHKKRPSSEEPYTVTVRREPAPADMELEPNDTLEQATPIGTAPESPPQAFTAHRVGWLAPQGDVDLYKLSLTAPMRVHAVLSALDRVDTELQVLEPDSTTDKARAILKVNEGGPKEPEVIPAITLAPGDHYFKVQAASHKVGDKWVRDQEDPDQTYSLDLSLSPDDGAFEREPNDTALTATALTAEKPLSGYLFPAKDVDIYKLDLSAMPVAAAAKITVTGVIKVPVWVEVHGANSLAIGELLNSADPGKPGIDAVVRQKLDPAIYYVIVRAHPLNKTTGTPQSDPETAYKVSLELE